MKRLQLLPIMLLLLSLSVFSQESNPVELFEGRGITSTPQRIMDLSYQNLQEVPISANLPGIEVLILDNNQLTELPNWINNLTNLRILSVRNNKLIEVNSLLSHCTKLEQLHLTGNAALTDLPNLSSCRNLMLVDVVGTRIREIPAHIRTMDHLYYFKYNPGEK